MYSMQNNGQFCSAPQEHWVCQNKCITGLMERLPRGMHFEYFKAFKEEGWRLPIPCPGRGDRYWDCGMTFDCFTQAKARVVFFLIYLTNTL